MIPKSVLKRRNERSYRYGRWLLIGLALVSIPLDGQKMYEEVGKAKIYLNKSLYDTINFYSATLMTHIIGVSSALGHEIWLTVACRLICTFVYQYDLSTRSNDTIPSNPKEMQKMLREKYPQYMNGLGGKMPNIDKMNMMGQQMGKMGTKTGKFSSKKKGTKTFEKASKTGKRGTSTRNTRTKAKIKNSFKKTEL